MAYYVTFLLDCYEDKVLDSPLHPEKPHHWKVTCDARGQVSVRGVDRLIATAKWNGRGLEDCRQAKAEVPGDAQWEAITTTIRRALVERTARGGPEDPSLVEKISSKERKQLHPRGAVPSADGRQYDRNGVDLAYMRKVKWGIGIGFVVPVILIVGVMLIMRPGRSTRASSKPVTPAPPMITSPSPSPSPAGPTDLLLADYPKLRWADVGVPAETSIGLVQKDADAELGKRMCVEAVIERIERRDVAGHKRFIGRAVDAHGDAVEFVALGDTGDLVKRAPATFCGAVVGKLGDAPVLVGMFDLPENRSPTAEK